MKTFAALLTILFLIACAGQKTGGDGTDTNTGRFKDGYEFEVNGCSTQTHEFASGSAEETKRLLCDALQDNELNGGCAEFLRQESFERKCPGLQWKPKGKGITASRETEEIESMVGHNDELSWLTLKKFSGISDFCEKVKLPEKEDGHTTFSTADEGISIICDDDNGSARFMFCTGETCEVTNMKVSLKPVEIKDGLRKVQFSVKLEGPAATVLYGSMAAFEKHEFKSSSDDQTRVKVKCSEDSCSFDVLIYTR
jgi:hypothetical protein